MYAPEFRTKLKWCVMVSCQLLKGDPKSPNSLGICSVFKDYLVIAHFLIESNF